MLPEERKGNLRGWIAGGGGRFCPVLPNGPGFPEAGRGSWIGPWGFRRGGGLWYEPAAGAGGWIWASPGAFAGGAFGGPAPVFCTAGTRPHWLLGGTFAGSNMSGTLTCTGGTPGTCGNCLFGLLIVLVNFLPVRREPSSKSCEITQADNLNRRRRLSRKAQWFKVEVGKAIRFFLA